MVSGTRTFGVHVTPASSDREKDSWYRPEEMRSEFQIMYTFPTASFACVCLSANLGASSMRRVGPHATPSRVWGLAWPPGTLVPSYSMREKNTRSFSETVSRGSGCIAYVWRGMNAFGAQGAPMSG